MFRLKSLNFLLLLFLLLCVQKRINVHKNESERAGKAFCCFNFLSILNLPINLNFVRECFEFDIAWLNVCVLKPWTSDYYFVVFLHTKANKCAKKWKRACMWSLLLGAIVVAVFICDCLCSKSWKNIREQLSDFFSKRFVFH